jgi:hypothetical protein
MAPIKKDIKKNKKVNKTKKNIVKKNNYCCHCKSDINKYDKKRKFCDNCIKNKEIMMTSKEIESIYQINFIIIDISKIRYDYIIIQTHYQYISEIYYYLPDFYKYVDYALDKYGSAKCEKDKYLQLVKIKKTKEKNDKMFDYVLEGVFLCLPKYNIPQNIFFEENIYNLTINKIRDYVYNYHHNVHQFTIYTLDYIELLLNKKIKIDEIIDAVLDPLFRETSKKHPVYYDFIENKKNMNINEIINILLLEQDGFLKN